jgi:hypothetical protein
MADLLAGKMNCSGVLRQFARDLRNQRSLAGAVRTDQGVKLLEADVERQVVGRDQAAELLEQPAHAKKRLSHNGLFAPSSRTTIGRHE